MQRLEQKNEKQLFVYSRNSVLSLVIENWHLNVVATIFFYLIYYYIEAI